MTPTPQKVLSERLKRSLTSSYQTMLGVIQGGALGYLALVAINGYERGLFGVIQWWLVLDTLFVIINIWFTITIDTTTWTWIPGFLDSLIPILIGLLELGVSYAITLVAGLGLRWWLGGMAIGSFFSFLGFRHTIQHARKEPASNTPLKDTKLQKAIRFRRNSTVIVAGILIPMAVVSWLAPFGPVPAFVGNAGINSSWAIGAVILVTLGLATSTVCAILYWQVVVTYARDGH